jgi:beta-glucuronidase
MSTFPAFPPVPATRPVYSLDGLWDFVFLGRVDLDAVRPEAVRVGEKMLVPSAFDAQPDYAGKRGAGLYRTGFVVPPGQPAQLMFGAVSMWSRIFVDGVALAEHACGYAPFVVGVPAAAQERRELAVLVDNRFDFDRVPMHEEYFDFYQYGGILREVTLQVLPARGPFIDTVQVTPLEGYRDGEVEVAVALAGEASTSVTFSTQFDDQPAQLHRAVPVKDRWVRLRLSVPNPRIWSPDTPQLHALRVALTAAGSGDGKTGKDMDDFAVRFGLRRIEARAGQLWLNGEKLQLRGYNRHEWHPNFGPCTPTLQMLADLRILRDLGCNFVRGSHYPQDQRFLSLCDELGFLVWEENLGWGQRAKTFASEKFVRDHRRALRAMVRASYNHPSIIMWGFLNEAGTDEGYVRPVLTDTIRELKALDPSRLVTFATMFLMNDKYLDLVDLVSINIYPGWYNCEGHDAPLDLVAPSMHQCFEHIDAVGLGEKPILVSEIGAEGLYGWRDPHHDFFTEEYQAEYLRRACVEALTHPRCCGIALWHFSDVRTYGGGWSLKRPRAFNNKGTLDEYRRPKLAYAAVRDVFRGVESNLR